MWMTEDHVVVIEEVSQPLRVENTRVGTSFLAKEEERLESQPLRVESTRVG